MKTIHRPKTIVTSENSIQTIQGEIPFLLRRSSVRRTLTIAIDAHANVRVFSPMSLGDQQINAFVLEKARWILGKLDAARKMRAVMGEREFDDGHSFLFLGKKFKLHVIEAEVKRGRIDFLAGQGWTVTVPEGLNEADRRRQVKARMVKWYRTQAQEILGGRVFHYARIMDVQPKKIGVRTQKRLWGCCDYRTQSINLNWQIILSPVEVVDYVIVHELCHLTIPNHSRRFWNRVERFMPKFRLYRQWLKVNHLEMVLP